MNTNGHYIHLTPEQLKAQIDFEQNFTLHCNTCKTDIAIGEYFYHVATHLIQTMNDQQEKNAS